MESFKNIDSMNSKSNKKQHTESQESKVGSKVTLKSIRRKLEDFKEVTGKLIGEGSYGRVKMVKEKATGHKYAMKIIPKSNLLSFTSIQNVKREIKIQSKLNHPHIIKLVYYFEDEDSVYMILEFARNGKNNKIGQKIRFSLKLNFLSFWPFWSFLWYYRSPKSDI